MSAVTTVIAELESRAGAGAVRSRTEDLQPFRVAGTEPLAVVQPDSVDALAAVLAFCSAADLPVEPAGAGTWLGAGAPPTRPPVVVSTARLNRIEEYEPADLVVGVQAGIVLRDLAPELARNRQFLPLDPPGAAGATIGATVALGAAGPLRAQHRLPRDLLLGVQVVTGDGRVLHYGGRVVKNVAGYDVVRLLAGSRGTLGILTSMHLLLRSAPVAERTCLLAAGTAGEAASLALAVRDRTGGEALELLSTAGAGVDAPAGAPWALLVRLTGSVEAVEEQTERLRGLGEVTVLDGAAATAVWDRLSADEAAADTYLRIADRPASLGATLARALDLAAAAGAPAPGGGTEVPDGWRIAVHAADGIVRLWPAPGAPAVQRERLHPAVHAQRADLSGWGGTLLCPVLPAALREGLEEPGPGDPRVAGIITALRRTFDPAGILSPGRHGF